MATKAKSGRSDNANLPPKLLEALLDPTAFDVRLPE